MKKCDDEVLATIVSRRFAGLDVAVVAVRMDGVPGVYVLGVAVKDRSGYEPLSWQIANGPEGAMRAHADALNDRALRLTRDQACAYVASSMRGRLSA